MSDKSSKANNDDDSGKVKKHLKHGKDIKPLHEEELKKHINKSDASNGDVLAELAAKTAELTDRYKERDDDKASKKVLELNDLEGKEPVDIFETIGNLPESDQKEKNAAKEAPHDSDPAVKLIREKLNIIYEKEPDAKKESDEVMAISHKRSKHQEFMYQLTTSGKSLAEIQTQWHNYYVELPNDEKHEVWQEFYKDQNATSSYAMHRNKELLDNKKPKNSEKGQTQKEKLKTSELSHSENTVHTNTKKTESRSPADIKESIKHKVSAGGQLKPIHHLKSLMFGLGLAAVVGLFVGGIFFNQVFIAPFISPSKTVSATPILGEFEGDIGPESKIIIPKINLEVPVVYGLGTVEEQAIQNGLEDGVVHYAASPEPGQRGNSVIVGHSSNNILNSGRYKFAFVLLKRLEVEDTFFIHKDGIRYTYKIYEKKIVPPTDVSVLGEAKEANSMTLITCDPPGTSINRLIIVAEQISPDPSGNTEADININTEEPAELPSNAESFWSRLINIF